MTHITLIAKHEGAKSIRDFRPISLYNILHKEIAKLRKKWYPSLKLDEEKGYDTLSWEYLEQFLLQISFSTCFISYMMTCVSSVQYRVLVNGWPSEPFRDPLRSQTGWSLSPCLYILCDKAISHAIVHLQSPHRITPQIARQGVKSAVTTVCLWSPFLYPKQ